MALRGLHIALVGPLPPPSGGMANQLLELERRFREEGAIVEIVQTNAAYRPACAGHIRGVRAILRLLPYLRRLWQASGRAEIVHVFANSGWSWHLFARPAINVATLRQRPTVVHYHGGEAQAFLARSARSVKRTLARAGALVVPSAFLQQVFRKFGLVATVVPNTLDLTAFGGRDSQDSTRLHIVVTRNLERIYDVATAIRAFAIVRERRPDARLSIAGTGPERAALDMLTRQLGVADAVRFTGRLDSMGVSQLLRSASVMVNPSLADNLPMSLLEAWAGGVPVVSTKVGGVLFMAQNEVNALLVEPGRPDEMAAAILRIADDSDLADRIVDHARRDVEQYSWPCVRGAWCAIYEHALDANRVVRVTA